MDVLKLIGLKFPLVAETRKIPNFGDYTSYDFSKEGRIAVKDLYKQLAKNQINDVRVHLPGEMATADYIQTRLNVYLDPDGIVQDVDWG